MRRRVVDSCSYHLRVFRARQVGHQLRRRNTVLHQRAPGDYKLRQRRSQTSKFGGTDSQDHSLFPFPLFLHSLSHSFLPPFYPFLPAGNFQIQLHFWYILSLGNAPGWQRFLSFFMPNRNVHLNQVNHIALTYFFWNLPPLKFYRPKQLLRSPPLVVKWTN